MKMNTLEKVYLCCAISRREMDVPEAVRVRAWKPIQRMLEMS